MDFAINVYQGLASSESEPTIYIYIMNYRERETILEKMMNIYMTAPKQHLSQTHTQRQRHTYTHTYIYIKKKEIRSVEIKLRRRGGGGGEYKYV